MYVNLALMIEFLLDRGTFIRIRDAAISAGMSADFYPMNPVTRHRNQLIIPLVRVIEGESREPVPVAEDEIDLFDLIGQAGSTK